MADLTANHALTGEWSNIVEGLGLENGTTYVVGARDVDAGAIVSYASTDDANPPTAGISGHPWMPLPRNGPPVQLQITPESGVTVWAKIGTGTANLVASEL